MVTRCHAPGAAPARPLLALLLALAGVFVVGTTGPATAATGPEPDRDWRISTDYDFDANPFSDQFGGPGFIMTEVFETLLSMDRHGAPDFAHSLATAYEVSKDGRHYTFHLRRGVRWSDGRPLTVQDVLYSWNEVGPESILFSRYLTNVDRAVAVDAHTVRIDMKRPDARIPSAFVYIVPRHIWEKVPKDKLATYDPCCSVVGSGPFTITRLDGNGTTVLEPNPYFYGPRGHIRRILLIKYGDKESQLRDLRAGSLDAMVEGESKWVGMLRGQDGVKVWNAPSPLNNVLVFNSCPPQGNDTCKAPGSHVDWKVVQDPAIRDALKWAIDRPNLLATAYRGVGGPGVSFIPPYYKPYGLWTDWSSDPEWGTGSIRTGPDASWPTADGPARAAEPAGATASRPSSPCPSARSRRRTRTPPSGSWPGRATSASGSNCSTSPPTGSRRTSTRHPPTTSGSSPPTTRSCGTNWATPPPRTDCWTC